MYLKSFVKVHNIHVSRLEGLITGRKHKGTTPVMKYMYILVPFFSVYTLVLFGNWKSIILMKPDLSLLFQQNYMVNSGELHVF